MNKHITIFSLIFTFFLVSISPIHAVTTTPTVTDTPTPTINEKTITTLKDRIASRVAQLNLVAKKGIMGTVNDISETQITITDLEHTKRFIDVDELTKFSSPDTKSSFGISDITKGTIIGAYGLYNKESQRLLARYIDVLVIPHLISGVITSLDSKNIVMYVSTNQEKDIYVDITTLTKILSYTKDTNLARSGFSKLIEGQRVFISGYPDKQNHSHILASRIIHFPALAANPHISVSSLPTATSSATPSPTKVPAQ